MEKQPRRSSVRIRLRTEDDISSWVQANRPNYVPITDDVEEEEPHVHFAPPDTKRSLISLSSGSSSTTDSEDQQPIALDGGYAWWIVAMSFCIHFICDGLSFSFGIIFPEIQNVFNCTKFEASLVGSFYLALPLVAGPLAGTLTDIYDCRLTTIIGGAMACIGVLLGYFLPPHIIPFAICFGIVTGIGLCFCYNSGIVIVTYYFEKKRAFATALAVCGSGAGTFIFPPIIEALMYKRSFWDTILCFAFFFGLLVIIGLMMRDVEWPNESTEYKQKKFLKKLDRMRDRDMESIRNGDAGGFNSLLPVRESILSGPRRACSLPVIPSYADDFLRKIEPSASIQSVRKAVSSLQDPVARSRSVAVFESSRPVALPTVPEYSMLVQNNLDHLDLQMSNSPYATVNSKNRVRMYSNCSLSMDALDQVAQRPNFALDDDESSSDSELSNDGDSSSSELSDKILNKSDVQHKEVKILCPSGETFIKAEQGTLGQDQLPKVNHVPGSQSARAVRSSVIGGYTHSRVPASNALGLRYVALREPLFLGLQSKAPSAPALFVKKKKKKNLRDVLHLRQIKETTKQTFAEYARLASDSRFTAFLVSIFILYLFFDIPYVNFPEYTHEELGVPQNQTSSLVSGIGLFNLISMILCGVVSDLEIVRKYLFLLYGVMITMAGMCLLGSTMATTYLMMQVISCAYGFFIASNYVLASVLLCELICVSDFQNGYGFLCLVEGIANMIGPALVGWVRDQSESYSIMFSVGGIGTIISGLIVIVIHFTISEEDESETDSDNTSKTRKPSKKCAIADSPAHELLISKSPSKQQNNSLDVPPLELTVV